MVTLPVMVVTNHSMRGANGFAVTTDQIGRCTMMMFQTWMVTNSHKVTGKEISMPRCPHCNVQLFGVTETTDPILAKVKNLLCWKCVKPLYLTPSELDSNREFGGGL